MKINIIWFRRDLRLHDNTALYHALKSNNPISPIFIFDNNILDKLSDKSDQRVVFIYEALGKMQQQLITIGSSLEIYIGTPMEAFQKLTQQYEIEEVFTNHDYEPYARDRDEQINQFLRSKGIVFHTYKDQVIFEKNDILKDSGQPYTVFTPYSKKWKSVFSAIKIEKYSSEKLFKNFLQRPPGKIPSIKAIGFEYVHKPFPSDTISKDIIENYNNTRDFPSLPGTSRLGVHLRFGTISIRELVSFATQYNETYLNELIWREFYQMILWHFPRVGIGKAFKPEYENIQWRNNEKEFEAWCNGQTGYPIADAGMRELNATGYMHNRVRMITASFLTKHLLIDWRWGEAYFAEKLLDFDLAANNGGWQWCAGSGCDAAPYFRIFNPALQTKKFDPELKYIKKWVPELNTLNYPTPIVEHDYARKRCLEVYKKALQQRQL